MVKEWHVWDFPDNIRIYLIDEFREWLFNELKGVCGTRAEISRRLGLHTSVVKSYLQTGYDSGGLKIYIPIKSIKKIIETFHSQLGTTFLEKLEKQHHCIQSSCRLAGLYAKASYKGDSKSLFYTFPHNL